MDLAYTVNCQRGDGLRESYYAYTREVFGFDLKVWHDAGYWDDRYIPHSLIDGGRVVANVSAALMTLQVHGKDIPAVQLGSVGVLPPYRGRGLARALMERVMAACKGYPLVFLFANEDAAGFYPRFGFRQIPQIQPCVCVEDNGAIQTPHRLPVDAEPVRRLAAANLRRSAVLDARGNPSICWFHLLYDFADAIYYIPEHDTLFLAEYEDDTAHVYDVLTESQVDFDSIQPYIQRPQTRKICFHFTPDWLGAAYEPVPWAEGGMYAAGDALGDADPFRFPVTAQT